MLKSILAVAALIAMSGAAFADSYTITVTNNLDEELLAPILVTDAGNDGHIFDGTYVTSEAEDQILTGDPKMLAMRIGEAMVAVGHGSDGPSGCSSCTGQVGHIEIRHRRDSAPCHCNGRANYGA